MRSIPSCSVDRFLENCPQGILQELPNVVAARTMQSPLMGDYGSMINPVGACATAAVSIERGRRQDQAGRLTLSWPARLTTFRSGVDRGLRRDERGGLR